LALIAVSDMAKLGPAMSARRWLVAWIVMALAGVQACGGSPTQPTPPPPPPPPPVASTWTLSGQVVGTIGRQPVANATIELGSLTATADDQGRFTMTAPTAPPSPHLVTVRAIGYRTRETTLRFPRTGEAIIDLTATAAPFSEDYYNQLARDSYERPDQRSQLWRWSSAPRIYLKTTDETGRTVVPEVVSYVAAALDDGVRLFSGGTFTATVEQGADERPPQVGWINVEIRQNLGLVIGENFCGVAQSAGGNPNRIELRLERCGCGSIKVPAALVLHEVGHALGFFHVADRNAVMYPFITGECRQRSITPIEQMHVEVAYSRPRGNMDPDRDPVGFFLVTAPLAGPRGPIP
jgi:hypothetical protein